MAPKLLGQVLVPDSAQSVAMMLGADVNLYRNAVDVLRTDDRLIAAALQAGTNGPVSSALVAAVQGGNGIEFGHSNASGYRNTLGALTNSGAGFLAFHAEHGTNVNTYRTRGVLGSIIEADLAGGFRFLKLDVFTADNQTPTVLAILNASGQFRTSGELRAQLGLAGQVTLGDDPARPNIYFGNAFDTILYRSDVSTLKTDGSLAVKKDLTVEGVAHFTNNSNLLLDSGYDLTISNGGRLVQTKDAGAGKVLTSDIDGKGTWQDLIVPPDVWVSPNPPNYVTNPGFEVDTAGWVTNAPAYFLNAGATLTRVTTESHSGSASGRIVTTAAVGYQGVAAALGVLPAGTYVASMWVKGASGGEILQLAGGHATAAVGWGNATPITTAWTKLTTAPFVVDGVAPVYICIRNNNASVYTVYVDDAALSLSAVDVSKVTLWVDTDEPDATVEAVRYIGASGQPVFTNGWANYDPGVGPAGRSAHFYKDRGRVYLGGVIKNGASGSVAFTLPAGYRPLSSPTIPVYTGAGGGAIGGVGIDSVTGNVTPSNITAGSSVTGWCFLDGVSFLAA